MLETIDLIYLFLVEKEIKYFSFNVLREEKRMFLTKDKHCANFKCFYKNVFN